MINIVIPMAGRGSRFSDAGYLDPKPLINIGGRRMIDIVVANLRPSEEHRFIFVCQNKHIEDYGLEGLLKGLADQVEIVGIEGVTQGAACTVLKAKKLIDNSDKLMIANSDQWVDLNIDDYLGNMENDGLIMTMTAEDEKWSFVDLDENQRVRGVVEKVKVSDEATVGVYNFRRGSDFCRYAEQMILAGDKSKGEYYVAPVYTYMCKDGATVDCYNVGAEGSGMWGLGIPSDLDVFLKSEVLTKAVSKE